MVLQGAQKTTPLNELQDSEHTESQQLEAIHGNENPVDQPSAPSPVEPLEDTTIVDHHKLEVAVAQVVEFDPNHQLAKLTSSWASFMAGASTFDTKF
jgi:hypothetical protein